MSHYREVEWKHTEYVSRNDILDPDEKGWQPYGTVGKIVERVPSYILRLLGESTSVPKTQKAPTIVVPDNLKAVIEAIELLRADKNHIEKSHDSLVGDFFCALGYVEYQDIKLGRVDVSIWDGNKPLIFIETKRNWNLSVDNDEGAVKQAYNYALEDGVRYVIITNGDYYAIFDRLKGLSYTSNIIAEFTLTNLQEEDIPSIDRLRRESLLRPSLEETFKHLCECFEMSE